MDVYASIYFMDPEEEKDDHYFIVFQKLEGNQAVFMKLYEEIKFKFINWNWFFWTDNK